VHLIYGKIHYPKALLSILKDFLWKIHPGIPERFGYCKNESSNKKLFPFIVENAPNRYVFSNLC